MALRAVTVIRGLVIAKPRSRKADEPPLFDEGGATSVAEAVGSFNEFGFIPWGWGGDEFLLRHFGSSTSLTLIIFNTFGAIKLITLLHQYIVR